VLLAPLAISAENPASGSAELERDSLPSNYIAASGQGDGETEECPSLEWARAFTSQFSAVTSGMTVDGQGNMYLTGNLFGTVDFNPDPVEEFILTAIDEGSSIYLLKLDAAGELVWARSYDSPFNINSFSVSVDAEGNVLVTGDYLEAADFDPTPDPQFELNAPSSNGQIFVLKVDDEGAPVWVRSMGGTQRDESFAISSDAAGNVYTTGTFTLIADFDPSPDSEFLFESETEEAFISKLDADGNFVLARRLGKLGALVEGRDIAAMAVSLLPGVSSVSQILTPIR
jgi:hypothetical protein